MSSSDGSESGDRGSWVPKSKGRGLTVVQAVDDAGDGQSFEQLSQEMGDDDDSQHPDSGSDPASWADYEPKSRWSTKAIFFAGAMFPILIALICATAYFGHGEYKAWEARQPPDLFGLKSPDAIAGDSIGYSQVVTYDNPDGSVEWTDDPAEALVPTVTREVIVVRGSELVICSQELDDNPSADDCKTIHMGWHWLHTLKDQEAWPAVNQSDLAICDAGKLIGWSMGGATDGLATVMTIGTDGVATTVITQVKGGAYYCVMPIAGNDKSHRLVARWYPPLEDRPTPEKVVGKDGSSVDAPLAFTEHVYAEEFVLKIYRGVQKTDK
ncbi:hypothetical protein HON52_01730 [Candidatus Uhrbacteria bacterium]|nr:hypothetical protein [Candidatus Uhrbacteria bacterium]